MALIPQLQSVPSADYCPGVKENGRCSTTLSRRIQVIEPFYYIDDEMLLRCLESDIIEPAKRRARENRRSLSIGTIDVPCAFLPVSSSVRIQLIPTKSYTSVHTVPCHRDAASIQGLCE